MRTGIADSPLHTGKAPAWLFKRMVRLAKGISEAILDEYGPDNFLERIANPFWFQAFGCVLGFDWHSSGLTTTTTGALKMALKDNELVRVCGGKGKSAMKTPEEIKSNPFDNDEDTLESLVYASRMAAKSDNACIQDSYQLYHHTFVFTSAGKWAVIQQGMNDRYARRYHWLSDRTKSFVEEGSEIVGVQNNFPVLDMTAKESRNVRNLSVEMINENPLRAIKYLRMPGHHGVKITKRDEEIIKKAYELQPRNYEELVSIRGFGPKKIRALALVSKLIYGEEASWRDPVRYSFAHGGKDGFPYPVDRKLYDSTVLTLREAIDRARMGKDDKVKALKKLNLIFSS